MITYGSAKLYPLLMFHLEFLFLAQMTVAFSLMFCTQMEEAATFLTKLAEPEDMKSINPCLCFAVVVYGLDFPISLLQHTVL